MLLRVQHLVIADHWERTITDPVHRAQLPRVHGLSPISPGQTSDPAIGGTWQGIPQLQNKPFVEQMPTPVFAKRGQALVFTYSMLHSGWVNEDSVSRKAYIMTWMPAGVPGFLERTRELHCFATKSCCIQLQIRWRPRFR